jgi:shikimate kinase
VAQAGLFADGAVDPLVLETAARFLPPLLLMGLRGAGKSTVGRAVARRLGRPFCDLDDEVERITGKRPAWWLRMRGEASFRSVEADCVERVRGRHGLVVAAGGGVLEHPRARRVVEECTWPLLLAVPPDVAAARVASCARERPLLADAGDVRTEARRLSERRCDAWQRVANAVIDGSREIDEVADDVVEAWTEVHPS